MQEIRPLLSSASVLAIELSDSAENIFDRLVFSDENDIVYKDDEYKNKYKKHYISEIREDLKWYGSVYRDIQYHFYMDGRSPETVVQRLLSEIEFGKD